MMRAAILRKPNHSLAIDQTLKPKAGSNELLVKVLFCGVCRTDLHIYEGDLIPPKYPVILGHEIVGIVEEAGEGVKNFRKGDGVGIPWLAQSCGVCFYCQKNKENLCENAQYTGFHRAGGFAEYTTCRSDFAIPLPSSLLNAEAAPFLCAGLIGYRCYKKADPEISLGLYGFGAAAHIIAQLALQEGKRVYAFTKEKDTASQEFALKLGVTWAGGIDARAPELLDAAILFAPVGSLVPLSLKALKKAGRCICGGIHMSAIPSFPYADLWGEKRIESVANLTREDALSFFRMLSRFSIHPQVALYRLEEVNCALKDLKNGALQGAAVLQI